MRALPAGTRVVTVSEPQVMTVISGDGSERLCSWTDDAGEEQRKRYALADLHDVKNCIRVRR